jgi:PAS domain S-box-containing protein
MFWTVFKRSRNAIALLDDHRRHVDVNGAYLELVGYKQSELVGQSIEKVIAGPPLPPLPQWWRTESHGDFFGDTELVRKDGSRVWVQYAAHPEVVTGRRLVLFVALDTRVGARAGVRATVGEGTGQPLSEREREIVHHVAMGRTSREIGEELRIAHDTVRSHVRNAMAKLNVRSRSHLVAVAMGTAWFPASHKRRPVSLRRPWKSHICAMTRTRKAANLLPCVTDDAPAGKCEVGGRSTEGPPPPRSRRPPTAPSEAIARSRPGWTTAARPPRRARRRSAPGPS